MLTKVWNKGNTQPLLVGIDIHIHYGNQYGSASGNENRSIARSTYTTLEQIPKGLYILL